VCEDEDVLTVHESRAVMDVLDMFRIIGATYRDLEDKSGIDIHALRFDGFDGNNETNQLSYTRFLRRTGRWEELLAEDALNSHSPRLEMYGRMVNAWKSSSDPFELTKDDLVRIREARNYPR